MSSSESSSRVDEDGLAIESRIMCGRTLTMQIWRKGMLLNWDMKICCKVVIQWVLWDHDTSRSQPKLSCQKFP
jgi:hypothetical protein